MAEELDGDDFSSYQFGVGVESEAMTHFAPADSRMSSRLITVGLSLLPLARLRRSSQVQNDESSPFIFGVI